MPLVPRRPSSSCSAFIGCLVFVSRIVLSFKWLSEFRVIIKLVVVIRCTIIRTFVCRPTRLLGRHQKHQPDLIFFFLRLPYDHLCFYAAFNLSGQPFHSMLNYKLGYLCFKIQTPSNHSSHYYLCSGIFCCRRYQQSMSVVRGFASVSCSVAYHSLR